MESAAKLISALASLAWPLVFAVLLVKLYGPLRALVESALGRRFTVKVAGNELTMEEASEQQRTVLTDVQNKIAQLEKQLVPTSPGSSIDSTPGSSSKRMLWVDDRPKNNSFLIAALEERGARVDTAKSTDEALKKLKDFRYEVVISDMARPEGGKAGIDLAEKMKTAAPGTPIYIFCGKWAATNLREEALAAGVAGITASGSTLMASLPL